MMEIVLSLTAGFASAAINSYLLSLEKTLNMADNN